MAAVTFRALFHEIVRRANFQFEPPNCRNRISMEEEG